ncbi:cupin domain-containing protein [Salinarimonas soli]|uniref:DUF4437 domain-containing protein n=1 Tax=Salinarimonas soli TaxID=1638099 RepID=A0A5B2V5E5_9HYPH|nr:cupin domain-containing protein [Salinarimonas soli]KAA2234743.1 DUF4437 domain-containing protein [Salinarimonas soli]
MRETSVLAALFVCSICFSAAAQDHHATARADDLKWSAPAAYAKGAQIAVIRGDPNKEGTYVVRLRVPAGFKIAPHTHPNDENVTVLSGTFGIGTGDKLDESKSVQLKPGGYSFVMKGMTHYAWFPEESVIQLHVTGPQGITYVNPADNPRKQ